MTATNSTTQTYISVCTRGNNNVIITPKRRRDATSFWRNNDAIIALCVGMCIFHAATFILQGSLALLSCCWPLRWHSSATAGRWWHSSRWGNLFMEPLQLDLWLILWISRLGTQVNIRYHYSDVTWASYLFHVMTSSSRMNIRNVIKCGLVTQGAILWKIGIVYIFW